MLPHFETDRLRLRPRTMDDLADCLALNSDPEVVRYIAGPWSDPEASRRHLIRRLEATYPAGLGYWSIFARSQPERFLGWVLLIPLDGHGPDIEIGWRLARSAWGSGYASEAAAALLRYGRETVGLDEIIALIDPLSGRSIRVAEKIGMRFAGEIAYRGESVLKYSVPRPGPTQ